MAKKTHAEIPQKPRPKLNQNYATGHFRSPASFAYGFESDQLGRI